MSARHSLRSRFRQLTIWNKLNTFGSLASVISLPVGIVSLAIGIIGLMIALRPARLTPDAARAGDCLATAPANAPGGLFVDVRVNDCDCWHRRTSCCPM